MRCSCIFFVSSMVDLLQVFVIQLALLRYKIQCEKQHLKGCKSDIKYALKPNKYTSNSR